MGRASMKLPSCSPAGFGVARLRCVRCARGVTGPKAVRSYVGADPEGQPLPRRAYSLSGSTLTRCGTVCNVIKEEELP